MSKPKIIAVVGPTASGKSALGIFLAKKLGGEVISADSRQVYRGLNIGTGKVTKKEMSGVPHHLLDVANPKKQFSVDDFVRLAQKACSGVLQKAKIPIVVGGTGLYVDMLVGRMSYPNVPPNPLLRKQLNKKSASELFVMLTKLDPRRAKTVEKQNPRRLIRAIEIARALGKNLVPSPEKKYEVLWLGLNLGEKIVKKKIRVRLRARIKSGMIAEAKKLHSPPAGGGLSYKRMDELGLEYRSLAKLLQKKITKEEFEVELERAIGAYAKRQMRWFKRNPDIVWIQNKTQALRLAQKFISR